MNDTRILVIEDNAKVRENLVEILQLSGYDVLSSVNGLEGVKRAMEELPDLILCDVMMPELDGFGVLNILAENSRTAGIPFVFITAKTEKEDIRRGMNLGADDYITKPFYKDELLRIIRVRLKKSVARYAAAPPPGEPLHLSDPARGMATLTATFRDSGRQQTYPTGQVIAREGDHPHYVFRVARGHVHLVRTHEYGREYIIAEFGPGELFGVSSVLEKIPYHYTARAAAGPADCQLLPAADLLRLINTDRTVTEAVMHLLAGTVMQQGERLVHQAYDSVRRRTALVLCDLGEKYGPEAIELSREELAQMVGATKESVIRAISDFKRDKLLRTDGRQIHILRPAALRGLMV